MEGERKVGSGRKWGCISRIQKERIERRGREGGAVVEVEVAVALEEEVDEEQGTIDCSLDRDRV